MFGGKEISTNGVLTNGLMSVIASFYDNSLSVDAISKLPAMFARDNEVVGLCTSLLSPYLLLYTLKSKAKTFYR